MRAFWVCFWLVACAPPAPPRARASTVPIAEVLSADGSASSLQAALGGSVAVVDLWATWCTACVRERPKLERLQAAYAGLGLRVLGLDVGEEPSVVSAYLAEHRVAYPVYLDPEFRIADALGDKQLPTLLVVDRDGRIVHRASSLDQPTLDAVKALLSGARKDRTDKPISAGFD